MATVIPITLVGDNLGKRHLYLNTLVNETYNRGEDFNTIKNLPEKSPIDRLFKIDLASKVKNVDYIIQNLKEEDMLYVSRALKCTWLIDKKYEKIINPQYLENILYPQMYTTAVTKMKHWTYIHLKDESRCRKFYQHYNEKNFDLAIKFLLKCSKDDIHDEFPKVIHKITPHYFKVLCEKSSCVAKMYFDYLANDNELKNLYLNKEREYFTTLRHLLKMDADIVLDITEKYFNRNSFNRFSPYQTKFIMGHQKKRFLNKPELYTSWLLNVQAIADSLNREEVKDLVLKLARAKYLNYWFCYKAVEPLIKRLKLDERVDFKKKVFVIRDIGEEEEKWPYETPESPVRDTEYLTIFDDQPPDLYEYETLLYPKKYPKRLVKKKRGMKNEIVEIMCSNKVKTLLDKLFDEFRFVSFGQTLYELSKRISAESSPQNREFMILVLVSKSGGRPDAIAALLQLLALHCNEPPNVRAAIIRSLVKRANIWRLPEISWNQLLQFGQGLGLDGNTPIANCHEGLHAVVIRSFVLTGECDQAVQKAFLSQFSTLSEYPFTATEKSIIKKMLPKMLFNIAKEKEINNEIVDSVRCIDKLVQTLRAYKIKIDTYPGLIDTIISLAEKDVLEVIYLITNLFKAKIARKELFRFTFDLTKSDASYINALKHDTTLLNGETLAKYFYHVFIKNANRFLRKLSLYFGEESGLASQFLIAFKSKKSLKSFARPLAFLLNNQFKSYLDKIEALGDIESKLLTSALKANAHLTRPTFDITTIDWKKNSVKHIANRLLKCPANKIDENIVELLKSKKTAKLALVLSKRTTYEADIFVKFANIRPTVAMKSGLKILKSFKDKADPLIWKTIKPIIQELDITKPEKKYIVKSLAEIDKIPVEIRPEYSTVLYISFKKLSLYKAMIPLCYVEIFLPNVDEDFIEDLLTQFLKDDFTVHSVSTEPKYITCTKLYIRILVKYILLCTDDHKQKNRLATFCDPFLAEMEEIKKSPKNELFEIFFHQILEHLKYNKVFLNNRYVSSLPVMERVIIWMHKLLTVEKNFQMFAQLHLSMLYFKAVRQSVKLAPEVFSEKKRKRNEGVEIVGNLFGKYIAKEVNTLGMKYFDSIPELYSQSLIKYLEKFTTNYYSLPSDFISSIVKGIFEGTKGFGYRLGVYLLLEKYCDIKNEHSSELKKIIKEMKINDESCLFLMSAYF